jgi:hydroxypyruvate isomerase
LKYKTCSATSSAPPQRAPGRCLRRHEIDETRELHYPAIVKAIIDTGYMGFLGQEFIPKREALASLAQGFRICDV